MESIEQIYTIYNQKKIMSQWRHRTNNSQYIKSPGIILYAKIVYIKYSNTSPQQKFLIIIIQFLKFIILFTVVAFRIRYIDCKSSAICCN